MREFQEKRKVRKIVYSKLTLVILIVILFFVARAAWGVYSKDRESEQLRADADARLATLQQRKQDMIDTNAELATPEGVEKQIRSTYRMTKPGEQLVVVTDLPTTTPQEPQMGFFERTWKDIADFFSGGE